MLLLPLRSPRVTHPHPNKAVIVVAVDVCRGGEDVLLPGR
ncbi:hypothetical protein HMPREF9056_00326 [Actinomyces sp. oral taxon 170 str. F0386]|nr:hypothetical protein HMPREF9056_00326 [Actinomyces sp. oral taxon 170 str. F0386]